MPLDNTAKIGDIINSLNGVQGLNQKAELVSVVNHMTDYENEVKTDMINKINAVSTQNPLNLPNNANWYDVVSSILNIKTHDSDKQKKWASGTVVSNTTKEVFTRLGDTNGQDCNTVTVNGLTFEPSKIILYKISSSTGSTDIVIYEKSTKLFTSYISPQIYYMGVSPTSGSVGSQSWKLNPGYVNSTGFKLPVYVNSGVTYYWVAFE